MLFLKANKSLFAFKKKQCVTIRSVKYIILAGGFATRLWPLTEETAKPLLEVGGKPIISSIVEVLPEDAEVFVCTNAAFYQDFLNWKKTFLSEGEDGDPRLRRKIQILQEPSFDETQKKGALAALSFVITTEKIKEDICLLAGDNLFFFPFAPFLEKARENPLLAVYDIGDKEEAKKFGVVVGQDGVVMEFQEKPEEPKSTLVSTGVLYFPQHLLADILYYAEEHSDDLGGIFEYFLRKQQRVEYHAFSEAWFDIGSFSAYLQAQHFVVGDQLLDLGSHKNKKVVQKGFVILGKDSEVTGSVLENVVVGEGTVVHGSYLKNVFIGPHSHIHGIDLEYKALRKETVVTNDAGMGYTLF